MSGAICIIPNCGRSCPPAEPFCSKHRDQPNPRVTVVDYQANRDAALREIIKASFVSGCCAALTYMNAGVPTEDIDKAGYEYAASLLNKVIAP